MKETKKQIVTPAVDVVTTKAKEQILTIVKNSDAIIDLKPVEQKKGLNLDETFKLIEALHLKKRHRDRLDTYIDLLNSFEIELKQEDLDNSGYYTGCSVVISDDNNGKFTLKNPTLIGEVIAFLCEKMTLKLAEIESEIVLPN